MADDEAVRRRLLELDVARADALVRGDVSALDRMTSADYTHVESNGSFRSKAEFLDSVRRRDYKFESFVIDENHVRLFGETAVVTGRYHNDVRTPDGLKPTKHARHIRIYVRSGETWQNVAHQATEVK
jgi:Domain of unknown function (DUF4440)